MCFLCCDICYFLVVWTLWIGQDWGDVCRWALLPGLLAGRLPTLQDAVAHAHAALDMLKKTVGQESWLAATTTASVHKQSAEVQVRRTPQI